MTTNSRVMAWTNRAWAAGASGAALAIAICGTQAAEVTYQRLVNPERYRGKSRGIGMIIRFPRRRESVSLWACRRLRILTV
jgi:hypothetical protein